MVIEINKDIDRYQESVAMGLTAKQLVFSIASVIVGGGIVLLLYRDRKSTRLNSSYKVQSRMPSSA